MYKNAYNKSEYNKDRPYNKIEKNRTFLQKRKESGKSRHETKRRQSRPSKKDDILKTLDTQKNRKIAKTTSRSRNQKPGKSEKNHSLIDFGSIVSNLIWMVVVLFIFNDMPFAVKALVVAFFGGQIVWGFIKSK